MVAPLSFLATIYDVNIEVRGGLRWGGLSPRARERADEMFGRPLLRMPLFVCFLLLRQEDFDYFFT